MNVKINYHNEKCSACSACVSVCPTNAILMLQDDKGFIYPKINEVKCVNCGLCGRVCQCFFGVETSEKEPSAYAVWHFDDKIRSKSQSGGLFYGLAETILNDGGIVYGAALSDDFEVKQIRVNAINALHRLQGSKYVQSDVDNSFKLVIDDLTIGKTVLYSGTSCMIDGLKRLLTQKGIDDANLYTCDLICHGVPSPKIFKDRIANLQSKYKLTSVNFRDKKFGWNSHIESYHFQDNSTVFEKFYTEIYYSHLAFRDSCFGCSYSKLSSKVSDITMADFWGIKAILPNIIDDNKGISLCICHSEKGRSLLNRSKLQSIQVSPENILVCNRHSDIHKPKIYDKFWEDYKKYGCDFCFKKYTSFGGIFSRIRRKIYKLLKMW